MIVVNNMYLDDLELYYGKGSKIDITSINILSRKNKTVINYKLKVTNLDYFKEVMEYGSNELLTKSWEMMGYPKTKLIFVCSYDNN